MAELDEKEALDSSDVEALKYLITKVQSEYMLIAEIGTWKGYSASIIASIIKPWKGHLYCIDHWQGISGTYKEAAERDIYNLFKANMVELKLWDIIHPLVMDSLSAAKIFANYILDLVFLDADHRYEAIKADILSWLPKIKDGGIICGHDWYRKEWAGLGHPGVTQAVCEIFQGNYKVIDDSRIWYHVK